MKTPTDHEYGQKALAHRLGITPRQFQRLKAAGNLDWIERLRDPVMGGREVDSWVVQSGTAFHSKHSTHVAEVRRDTANVRWDKNRLWRIT